MLIWLMKYNWADIIMPTTVPTRTSLDPLFDFVLRMRAGVVSELFASHIQIQEVTIA